MLIYFDNDGSFGKKAIDCPVLSGEHPIGIIKDVTESTVTCLIWDRFIRTQVRGINATDGTKDYSSIGIC